MIQSLIVLVQYKLDTVLSAGDTVTGIDKTSAFMELTFWWGIWSITEYFFFFFNFRL